MFNPRLQESGTNTFNNDWLNFARMHTLHFWKESVVYTRIPGAYCVDIRKSLIKANGFSEDWPEAVAQVNDLIFCDNLAAAWKTEKRFVVVQHPVARILKIIEHLRENADNCAGTWLEKTGKSWQDVTLRQLVGRLADDLDLRCASHWWCNQEYCLLYRSSWYSRIFRQNQHDDLAWWLGEQGIQLPKTEQKLDWEPDTKAQPQRSALADAPLGHVNHDYTPDGSNWDEWVDDDLVREIQRGYTDDFVLYSNAH